MSRQVSSIMEQLIVLEQLLCRVVRLHALRTDEALTSRSMPSETNVKITDHPALILQLCLQGRKKNQVTSDV